MRIRLILFYNLLISPLIGLSQSYPVNKINGLHTKELYNLMVDSKGFLWIGHDLGISRYDGVNFISYSNPGETSLSTTDLLEDKRGRIWCHNFTGQIFYIENETMHLLKAYDSKSENTFPRIALVDDQLVATTKRGLFICNTKNLNCRYVGCVNAPGKGTTSLSLINHTIVAYGDGNWFTYRIGEKLRMVSLNGDSIGYIKYNSSVLNVASFKDTAFLFSNPSGFLAEITLNGNNLKLNKRIRTGSYINTITVDSQKVWVNTIHKSFLLNNPAQTFNGYDLSDIKTDNEGNEWYSSLKNGLVVKYKHLSNTLLPLKVNTDDDMVKCVQPWGTTLLLGMQNGDIILFDALHSGILKKITLPGNPESVNYIYNLEGSKFLVGTSINTYEIDIKNGDIKLYPFIKTLKQANKTNDFLLSASANGLIVLPLKNSVGLPPATINKFKGLVFEHDLDGDYLGYKMRCYSTCYDQTNNSIYAAFKDGLYTINQHGINPVFYHKSIIHAACVENVNGKILIGTINDGLLIKDNNALKHITTNDGLSSSAVLKIKRTENWIWLIGAGVINVLDAKDLKLITNLDLSALSDIQVQDITEIRNKAFIATSDGLYSLALIQSVQKQHLKNYLQTILVNNKQLAYNHNNSFSYYENTIQFNLTAPHYYRANDIYFKYSLRGSNNQDWQVTEPGERSITFSALSPGKYRFKAFAIHPQFGVATNPIVYEFTIGEKWWQSWWFKTLVALFIIGMITYISANYFLNRLRTQKAIYEQKLAVQNERQRISGEMHDDVGAGLSAIKLYVNMIENKNDQSVDLIQIGAMISDMSDKIKEIIWSTNTANDTLESLLYYIQFQTQKLFEHSDTAIDIIIPSDIPDYFITSEKRRNIYLITNELIHNAIKHAKASIVRFEISIEKDKLRVLIKDNGIGFESANKNPYGMGMKNVTIRIEKLKGKMHLDSEGGGTTINLEIPITNL